jgi:hypothetical protein
VNPISAAGGAVRRERLGDGAAQLVHDEVMGLLQMAVMPLPVIATPPSLPP